MPEPDQTPTTIPNPNNPSGQSPIDPYLSLILQNPDLASKYRDDAERYGTALQTELLQQSYDLTRQSMANQEALTPLYLEEAGYTLNPYDPEQGGSPFMLGGQQYSITKEADPLQDTNKEIAAAGAERTLKALRGEIDVDPAVVQDIDRQREMLHERLIRQLGPGYENTESGRRALEEFNRNETMINYQVRHGELNAAQAIQQNAEQAYRGNTANQAGYLQGYSHFPQQATANLSEGLSSADELARRLQNERVQIYGANKGVGIAASQARGQALGGLISGGLGAATAVGIAV